MSILSTHNLAKSARAIIRAIRSGTRRFLGKRRNQVLIIFLITFSVFSYLTNPFVRFSIITDPFNDISIQNQSPALSKDTSLIVRNGAFFKRLAFFKSGWHIITNSFTHTPKAKAGSVDDIIDQIHALRFNPDLPYLISGDHFTVLYPRSLGIFYHSLLDSRTGRSDSDWANRQVIYLKTASYALQTYEQSPELSTTIVPIAPRSVVLTNVYAYPSDTLYSLLFALKITTDSSYLQSIYPFESTHQRQLDPNTINIAHTLLQEHNSSLQNHLRTYINYVQDPATHLIRNDISLSGTKDLVKRQSSFYDNVILHQTLTLAKQLGLSDIDQSQLDDLKHAILDSFWDQQAGHFLDDLSQQSVADHYYSSDWLIAYQTGFLSPYKDSELQYLQKSVDYIRRNAIDQPFGIQYQADPRPHQLHLVPRIGAPTYASTAIWSHWGIEYTKLLISLAQVTRDSIYLNEADRQLSTYAYNIKRYRGYPEVYDASGDFYRSFFYKSVRTTGWVVNFEQARDMLDWTKNQLEPEQNNPVLTPIEVND